MENKLLYKIALPKLTGVGPILTKVLLSYCGNEEEIFKKNRKELAKIPQLGNITAHKIIESREAALSRARDELPFIKKNNIQVISYVDKEYPNRLKYCDDSPVMLFFKGNADLNSEKVISIVGTRRVTNYGKKLIKDFLYELRGSDVLIVSGLAYGADTKVHQACVEFQIPTLGVLAHGLDILYPPRNKKLAAQMQKNGGLLTEYFSNTNPDRQNFPERNRIVAGISDATIIVESDVKGGSLITADIAFSYNRDVFTFPGNVGSQYSSGCNNLIKYQKASLIENTADVFRVLGWEKTMASQQSRQRQLFLDLGEIDQKIVKQLLSESLSAQQISVKSSLPLSLIQTHLLNLELQGVVRISPGNLYTLN